MRKDATKRIPGLLCGTLQGHCCGNHYQLPPCISLGDLAALIRDPCIDSMSIRRLKAWYTRRYAAVTATAISTAPTRNVSSVAFPPLDDKNVRWYSKVVPRIRDQAMTRHATEEDDVDRKASIERAKETPRSRNSPGNIRMRFSWTSTARIARDHRSSIIIIYLAAYVLVPDDISSISGPSTAEVTTDHHRQSHPLSK